MINSGLNKMTSTEIEETKIIFKCLFEGDIGDIEATFVDKGITKMTTETMFILRHVISGELDNLNMSLYSKTVNDVYKLYQEARENSKPIHGTFYPELRQRYFDLLDAEPVEDSTKPFENAHLSWMLVKLSEEDMSETKKHRWLGYIQGVMAMKEHINVNDERDATRDVFKGK